MINHLILAQDGEVGGGVFLPDGGGVPAEGVANQLPERFVSIDLAVVGVLRIAILATGEGSCRTVVAVLLDKRAGRTDIGVLVIRSGYPVSGQ